jgi:hypothetical protein
MSQRIQDLDSTTQEGDSNQDVIIHEPYIPYSLKNALTGRNLFSCEIQILNSENVR